MYSGGSARKILRVGLSDKTSRQKTPSEEVAWDSIGGASLGIKPLFGEVRKGTDPLGPDNKLIFALGPLAGAGIPCASRMAAMGKSPLTGAVDMAPSGGEFPTEIRFAGWNAVSAGAGRCTLDPVS